MNIHKDDLGSLSTRQLLSRRRAAAGRLGDVEQVLAGTLTEQGRRCGRPGCRCADGEPHGPYAYFTPHPAGRGRARYVSAALAGVVRRYLGPGEQAQAVLAEISFGSLKSHTPAWSAVTTTRSWLVSSVSVFSVSRTLGPTRSPVGATIPS